MIKSNLLKPIAEKTDYGNGVALSLIFQRTDTGESFGSHEEMLEYRDCLFVAAGEDPAIVILKLRDLANRIEHKLIRANI